MTAAALAHRRAAFAPLLVAGLAVAGCATLALADPEEPGRYPLCPFYALTGRWCPGCGSLRAMGRLVRLDVVGAAAFNPLLLLALPYLLYRYAAWALARVDGPALPRADLPAWGIRLLLVGVLAYWVVRNLPGFGFLAPG